MKFTKEQTVAAITEAVNTQSTNHGFTYGDGLKFRQETLGVDGTLSGSTPRLEEFLGGLFHIAGVRDKTLLFILKALGDGIFETGIKAGLKLAQLQETTKGVGA